MSELLAQLKKENILRLIQGGKRLDGRGLEDYRDVSIETGFNARAEGSARVRIGDTQVMVGVKLELGVPYPDSPNSGVLSVNAELVPLASPTFESGPPNENCIELARVVDRGVRESECIELEKLVLEPGKKVWMVYIDIWVLDHDGNLIDASGLGALAALYNAKVPEVKLEGEEYVPTGNYSPLPMRDKPIPVTITKIGDYLFMDANVEEEYAMDARITITTNQKGEICAMQKGNTGQFDEGEILKSAELSISKGKGLREKLFKTI